MKIAVLATLLMVGCCFGQQYGNYSLAPRAEPCIGDGLTCVNCRRLTMCSGSTPTGPPIPCANNEICHNRVCTKPPATYPPCDPYEEVAADNYPPCGSVGQFPHPGNCQYWLQCSAAGGRPTLHRCDGNGDYGYHPGKFTCSVRLTNKRCSKYPVPLCPYYFYEAALKENRNIYYRCELIPSYDPVLLYPVMYRCPNGQNYPCRT